MRIAGSGKSSFAVMVAILLLGNMAMSVLIWREARLARKPPGTTSPQELAAEIEKIKRQLDNVTTGGTGPTRTGPYEYPVKRYSIIYNKTMSFVFFAVLLNISVSALVYWRILKKLAPEKKILSDIRTCLLEVKENVHLACEVGDDAKDQLLHETEMLLKKAGSEFDRLETPVISNQHTNGGSSRIGSRLFPGVRKLGLFVVVPVALLLSLVAHHCYVDWRSGRGLFHQRRAERISPANKEWTDKPLDLGVFAETPVLIEQGYRGFDVISLGQRFFGLANEDGEFDVNKAERNEYRLCVEGSSVEHVKQLVEILGTPTPPEDACVVPVDEKGFVIDMNVARAKTGAVDDQLEWARISASASTSGPAFRAPRVFDGDPKSFWEAGGYPHFWVQITYPKPRAVSGYMLQAAAGTERMPKSWQLEGSNDEEAWSKVHEQVEEPHWQEDEKQRYILAKRAFYRSYRLNLTPGNEQIVRIYELRLLP